MSKKFLKVLFAVILMGAFSGCGSNADQNGGSYGDTGPFVAMKVSEQEDNLMEEEALAGLGQDSDDYVGLDDQSTDNNDDGLTSGGDEGEEEGPTSQEENGVAVDEGPRNFICILAGPGKSVRLGMVEDSLAEHGKTPGVVCMSEIACNEQVSRIFEVKGPEKRGFCPDKNKHVLNLSYEELQTLIDDVESPE